MSQTPGGTQSVERALSLLTAFADYPGGALRISELCAETGLGQSTVSRMVGSLERLGFVRQDPRTGLYQLGPAAVSMGTVALNSYPVFRAARQITQNLAHATGLGANVAQRDDRSLFYLCNFEGAAAPKSFTMSGRGGPLHATGLGKALLSGMTDREVDAYFNRHPKPLTPYTVTDRHEMAAVLAEIRARGYATEVEELAFGRACLAAPIRDASGQIVAGLSVSGPVSVLDLRSPHAELALRVIEAAEDVSVELGHSASVNASA